MKDHTSATPTHVSIIMDGNGRWARERGKERVFGHMNGVESVRAVTEAAAKAGVGYLSLYAFSEENWGRPEEEVSYLMSLMMKSLQDELATLMKNNVRLMVLGDRTRLEPVLCMAIDGTVEATAANTGLTLIIFLNYSGRWDIMQAAERMAKEAVASGVAPEHVDREMFEKYLVTAGIPDPDLIIRTSGECRLSNYLLWQCAYSEFYFTDVMWPDFGEDEFNEALKDYSNRERRFGKLK